MPGLLRIASISAAACAALVAPAGAAVVVKTQEVLGYATTAVRLAPTSSGGGAAAYWGFTDGVYLSLQQPDATWGSHVRMATGPAADVQVVSGPSGPAGVVVTRKPGQQRDSWTYWLAPATETATPTEPEAIPMPAGAYLESAPPRALADGTIVFLASRFDSGVNLGTLLTFERRPDGTYTDPQPLSTVAQRATGLQPAGDRLVALFTAYTGSLWTLYATERKPDGAWTTPQAVSGPGDNADNGASTPQLVGAGGSLLAVWNGAPPGSLCPNAVMAAGRTGAGTWTAPANLADGAMRPTAALSSAGALGIVWDAFDGESFTTRVPSAGAESGTDPLPDTGGIEERPVAIDDAGHLLLLRTGAFDHPRLELDERSPGRCFARRAFLTPPDTRTDASLLLGADGAGAAAWRDTSSGLVSVASLAQGATVADHCAKDPQPTPTPSPTPYAIPLTLRLLSPGRTVHRRALRHGLRVVVRLTVPARLDVTVRAGRSTRRRLQARAGRTALRIRVRRPGRRLRLVVRAQDAQGTTRTARRAVRVVR